MRDLADDMRDYFDALADTVPAAGPPERRRRLLPIAVALVVAAAIGIAALTRPHPRREPVRVVAPPTTVAVAEQRGVRLTLRLVSGPSGPYTVETTIENVGAAPVQMIGQLDPDGCHTFPVQVEAVRTAWAPGDKPWPGAEAFLGPISARGWPDLESRGSPFTDPRLDETKRAVQERQGYVACSLVGGEVGSFLPGQRATRTFTWTPPAGWPGGRHEVVAGYWLGIDGNDMRHPVTVTARIAVDVRTDVADAMGPAEALERLARDPGFQAETAKHTELMGVTSLWSPAAWTIAMQWTDSSSAYWTVDPQGTVTRKG
jgi:hypothetical protein